MGRVVSSRVSEKSGVCLKIGRYFRPKRLKKLNIFSKEIIAAPFYSLTIKTNENQKFFQKFLSQFRFPIPMLSEVARIPYQLCLQSSQYLNADIVFYPHNLFQPSSAEFALSKE